MVPRARTADQQSVWGWADSAENQNESCLLHVRCLTAVSHCFGMQGIPIFLRSRLNERTAHHQYPDIADNCPGQNKSNFIMWFFQDLICRNM